MSEAKHIAFVKTTWTPSQLNILISCCTALVNNGSYAQCKVVLSHFHFENFSQLPKQLQDAFSEDVWKKIFPYLRKKHITCLEMLYFYSMYKSGTSFRSIADQIGRSYVRIVQYCKAIEDAQEVEFSENQRMTLGRLVHQHATLREVTRSSGLTTEEVLSFLKTM